MYEGNEFPCTMTKIVEYIYVCNVTTICWLTAAWWQYRVMHICKIMGPVCVAYDRRCYVECVLMVRDTRLEGLMYLLCLYLVMRLCCVPYKPSRGVCIYDSNMHHPVAHNSTAAAARLTQISAHTRAAAILVLVWFSHNGLGYVTHRYGTMLPEIPEPHIYFHICISLSSHYKTTLLCYITIMNLV